MKHLDQTLPQSLVERLRAAQEHAMSVAPLVGGFPVLARILREAGFKLNFWTLPSCQSVYVMESGEAVVQPGTPLVSASQTVPHWDEAALVRALRADQAGQTSFSEFLRASWNAGCVSYDVDLIGRTVTYRGVNGEHYLENYPAA